MTQKTNIGHMKMMADIRRAEAASGVKVTATYQRGIASHLVQASSEGDARRFTEAAEQLGLDVG